jgi:hypothetical protein
MQRNKNTKPFQKALIVSNYHSMFDDLRKNKIKFTGEPLDSDIVESIRSNPNSKITILEDDIKHSLNIQKGEEFAKSNYSSISAYDESIMKIPSLKGIAYFTCHCIIRMTERDFDPICSLNANYFTRAKDVAKNSDVFHHLGLDGDGNPEKVESIYKLYYHEDRSDLILNNIPDHSILLIDGPLVGQQLTSRTRSMAKALLERDIITIFIVKNSDSLMLVSELNDSGKYNSDLDWADENLDSGSRSSFIKYKDQKGGNTEIFCYLKSFDNVSPLRISFMEEILNDKGDDLVNSIMNLLYYLVIDQGTPKDPQLRLISVAEMYAKEIIKYANPYGKMQSIGLVPTVNQSRWGRG